MIIAAESSWKLGSLAEKMKELVKLANSLDNLDKEAWMEIIGSAERSVGEKLGTAAVEGESNSLKVWNEIFPFVQIIRFGLASDTISRPDRNHIVGAVISTISELLSPMELAGVCATAAFRALYSSERRAMPIIVPFPFGQREPEDDEENPLVT